MSVFSVFGILELGFILDFEFWILDLTGDLAPFGEAALRFALTW